MNREEKIKTPIGMITIYKNKIPQNYQCAVEQKITRISETHIRIRTLDLSVSWEKQIFSPRIIQNCMDPEKITVYPLEIEWKGDNVVITDRYGTKEWTAGEKLPEIREWCPQVKNLKCNPCRNCGRC